VVVVDVTESSLRQFGLIVPRGAVVTQVAAGSPAADANLMVGAVIVAYDGQRVGSANDLVRLIAASQPDQEIELTYYLGRRLMRQTIRLGAAPATSDRTTPRSPPSIPAPSDDLLYPNGPRRPALGVLQDLVEELGNRGTGSAVEDRMREQAELRQQIMQLQKTMEQLLRRVEQLEARLGPPAEQPAEQPPEEAKND
jgi:membrane-associated protease RseP (regulator of RpoE activity)